MKKLSLKGNKEKGYSFKCGGEELAKVMFYYGLIDSIDDSNPKIMCPFHEDKNPSMIVNLNDGNYFCFGCGESGDAVKFVRKLNQDKNDLLALKEYFEILQCNKVNKIGVGLKKMKKEKNDAYFSQMLIEAEDYYYGLSSVDWTKKAYNQDEQEEIKKARRYMLKRGFKPSTLKNCKAKVTYNSQYGIVFPMLENGKFKGWVCRTMRKDVEKRRKYLYNEGFRRKTSLIGRFKPGEPLYIVEGFMDYLKMRQNGVHNVVAILGWKMSDDQIEKLKELGITHVISALDNDECGKKGTKYLRTKFNVTRFQYLKGIKDPGEMTKELFDKMNKRTLEKYFKENK